MSENLTEERDKTNVNLQNRIQKNRAAIAKAQFDLISNVETLRATMPEQDLKVFLVVECGISKSELAPILSFKETLGGHEAILRKRSIPFAVVRALIATDVETRKVALDSLAAGNDVDVHRIASLRRKLTRQKIGPRVMAERARRNALAKSAVAHARETIDPFSRSVADLLDEIDRFVDEFIPYPSGDEEDYIPLTSDRFVAAKKSIEARAKSTQSEFRRIYGEVRPVPGTFTMWRTGSHAQRLAAAAGALDLFARGKFAWDGGFAFKNDFLFSTEIQDALAYLLPCDPPSEAEVVDDEKPRKQLQFLEICAGAGGQAIGLMQAGFAPVGLIERNINACRTLRKNYSWPVIRTSLQRLSSEELRKRYQGIDLLAGGVECRAFSRAGKQRGPADPRNLFDEAVRFVKAIEPRAFLFENVSGFKDQKFLGYRASVYRQLEEAGYHVSKLHTLVGTDFGLAQKRERVVVMGIRRSEADGLHAPVPSEGGITMGRALKDVLFPHLNQGNSAYDRWANGWLTEHGAKSSHTVLAKLYDPSTKLAEHWEEIGFRIDSERIADGPAEPDREDLAGVLPYLTIEVIRVLQGFPPEWKFEGKLPSTRFEQIGNAFPPSMAKAAGLSIARSLSGDDWRANKEPLSLFSEERIGKPPIRKSGPLLTTPDVDFYRKVEDDLRIELDRYKLAKNKVKIAEFKEYLKAAKSETKAAIKRREAVVRMWRKRAEERATAQALTTAADAVIGA
ncbi:DNA-cytosine methyltransferase [Peteryoungia aggregata LMG 23059]|uniref:DNA (cytosine-5-)-methyltransferase n=1 Tax=Peteryoungia aggregata LMG 23059 TaxID=1368425 RepID=A0ABU0G6F3_9HYPH|nr:DNA (cytosine-5-)-methyltransferase [Peteryoungia aggregata]MDQ0420917.1 DNA-cytosine methyltransferase [Peteryoungia aggregata LMG 23059]